MRSGIVERDLDGVDDLEIDRRTVDVEHLAPEAEQLAGGVALPARQPLDLADRHLERPATFGLQHDGLLVRGAVEHRGLQGVLRRTLNNLELHGTLPD